MRIRFPPAKDAVGEWHPSCCLDRPGLPNRSAAVAALLSLSDVDAVPHCRENAVGPSLLRHWPRPLFKLPSPALFDYGIISPSFISSFCVSPLHSFFGTRTLPFCSDWCPVLLLCTSSSPSSFAHGSPSSANFRCTSAGSVSYFASTSLILFNESGDDDKYSIRLQSKPSPFRVICEWAISPVSGYGSSLNIPSPSPLPGHIFSPRSGDAQKSHFWKASGVISSLDFPLPPSRISFSKFTLRPISISTLRCSANLAFAANA